MITSGFFPSVNGDRKYANSFLAQWVHSFISDGVYNGSFAVTAGENMNVILPLGQAWIGGYYCRNDGNITLPIANADGVLKRKDTIVLRWDINTRNITVQVLTGTFASNPIAPGIVRTAEQYDLKLAEIYIAAGTTVITQAMITDTRLDKSVCGIVTGAISQVDTTTLYNQIQADLANFQSVNEADFTAWVNSLKDVLDADTAGNLLNLINEHKADTAIHTTQEEKDKISLSVPNTRKVNNKALTNDITLNAADVGAIPTSDSNSFLGHTNFNYTSQNGGDANNYVTEYHGFVFNMTNTYFNYGFLEVSSFNGDGFAPSNAGVVRQKMTEWNTGNVAARIKQSGVWSAWVMQYSTANITMSTGAPSGGSNGDIWHQYK